MADSVGYATLVVLDRLNPAERISLVLHDLFDVPFEEIARITGRSLEAVRQLASRARRRVRGVTTLPEGELMQQQSLVEKFLTALRLGDATKLLEVLDPDFAVRADATTAPEVPADIHGAEAWAKQAIQAARGARLARMAMVEGSVGLLVAPRGSAVPGVAIHVRQWPYCSDGSDRQSPTPAHDRRRRHGRLSRTMISTAERDLCGKYSP